MKTNEKLAGYLRQVKPISGTARIKLSSYGHPMHDDRAHNLVKEQIRLY